MSHTERRTMMEIGPLEYVVLGFEDRQFASEVLPELNAIQESGLIRAVDLVFVDKETDGTLAVQEVSELSKEELAAYEGLADEIAGLLTTEDIEHLAEAIPSGTSAVVVLFEHTWTLRLADAVRRAGGVFFAGGMVAPDALEKVSTELATAKEEHHA
jgi:Family of unknown function (DUF6325)